MALYSCVKCGNKVSDKGVRCPKCGYSIEETVQKAKKEEELKQLRKQQLERIDYSINHYEDKRDALKKKQIELSDINKLRLQIALELSNGSEPWNQKDFAVAKEILEQTQNELPALYESVRATVEKVVSQSECDIENRRGKHTTCPECGANYCAELLECPECGWTADRALAEKYSLFEGEKVKAFISELLEELEWESERLSLELRWEEWSDKELFLFLQQLRNFRNVARDDFTSPLWDNIGKEYYPAQNEKQGIVFNEYGVADPIRKTVQIETDGMSPIIAAALGRLNRNKKDVATECMSRFLSEILGETVQLDEKVQLYYPIVFSALRALEKSERDILKQRFGLTDGRVHTWEDICDIHRVSYDWVSEYRQRAINASKKLRGLPQVKMLKEVADLYAQVN